MYLEELKEKIDMACKVLEQTGDRPLRNIQVEWDIDSQRLDSAPSVDVTEISYNVLKPDRVKIVIS